MLSCRFIADGHRLTVVVTATICGLVMATGMVTAEAAITRLRLVEVMLQTATLRAVQVLPMVVRERTRRAGTSAVADVRRKVLLRVRPNPHRVRFLRAMAATPYG